MNMAVNDVNGSDLNINGSLTQLFCRLFSKRPVVTPVLLNMRGNVTRGGENKKRKQPSLTEVKIFCMYTFYESQGLYLHIIRALPGLLKGSMQVKGREVYASTFCKESALVSHFLLHL